MGSDPHEIACWQRLGDDVTTSGRLTEVNVTALNELGVREVINLALIDSPGALAGEDRLLAEAGMAYRHIPVPFDAPDEHHFAAFCEAMAQAARPVHVHCIMNWRVSAFFYRYNRDVLGMDEVQARALMEQQWSPATNANRDAPTWARFIGDA